MVGCPQEGARRRQWYNMTSAICPIKEQHSHGRGLIWMRMNTNFFARADSLADIQYVIDISYWLMSDHQHRALEILGSLGSLLPLIRSAIIRQLANIAKIFLEWYQKRHLQLHARYDTGPSSLPAQPSIILHTLTASFLDPSSFRIPTSPEHS